MSTPLRGWTEPSPSVRIHEITNLHFHQEKAISTRVNSEHPWMPHLYSQFIAENVLANDDAAAIIIKLSEMCTFEEWHFDFNMEFIWLKTIAKTRKLPYQIISSLLVFALASIDADSVVIITKTQFKKYYIICPA